MTQSKRKRYPRPETATQVWYGVEYELDLVAIKEAALDAVIAGKLELPISESLASKAGCVRITIDRLWRGQPMKVQTVRSVLKVLGVPWDLVVRVKPAEARRTWWSRVVPGEAAL